MDVYNLLPAGETTVELMDGIAYDARLSELQKKYKNGVIAQYDWFIEYVKSYDIGKPIPYHENFGITPEEYAERRQRIDSTRYYSNGLQKIWIKHVDGTIRMEGKKKLKQFNNIVFYPKENTVKVGDYTLPYIGEIIIEGAQNRFGKTWYGYAWAYENPKGIHLDAMKDIYRLDLVRYKIFLGEDHENNVLLHFEATEIDDGVVVIDIDIPLII